jgi:hypothetical protein
VLRDPVEPSNPPPEVADGRARSLGPRHWRAGKITVAPTPLAGQIGEQKDVCWYGGKATAHGTILNPDDFVAEPPLDPLLQRHEGQNTKLKLVKRQMYRPANLDLLRASVIGAHINSAKTCTNFASEPIFHVDPQSDWRDAGFNIYWLYII